MGDNEQPSSFGIKKIVDCKVVEGGKQMYKVKWIATWEPAETLASCQHLVDDFWRRVNNAKRNEELAQQHRKRLRPYIEHVNISLINPDLGNHSYKDRKAYDGMSSVSHTNGHSVSISYPQPVNQNPLRIAETPVIHDRTDESEPHTPQHILPVKIQEKDSLNGYNFGEQRLFDFDQSLRTNSTFAAAAAVISPRKSPQSKKKSGMPATLRKEESKDSKMTDSCKPVTCDPVGKPISNTGLKYLENFDNPYVKIVLVCRSCNKEQSMKRPDTWKRHFLTHAAKEDLPHKCQYCDKRFITSGNLKTHLKTHIKGENAVKKEENWFADFSQQRQRQQQLRE